MGNSMLSSVRLDEGLHAALPSPVAHLSCSSGLALVRLRGLWAGGSRVLGGGPEVRALGTPYRVPWECPPSCPWVVTMTQDCLPARTKASSLWFGSDGLLTLTLL